MSLKLNSRTDTWAERTSGLGGSNGHTLLVAHRRTTSGSSVNTVIHSSWGSSFCKVMYNGTGVLDYETSGGNQTPDTAPTHTLNEWAWYAMTVSATGSMKIYFWDAARTRTDVETGVTMGAAAPSAVRFGDHQWDETAVGEFRYGRFWNSELSAAQLDAEVASATVVSSTDLKGDWPLANSTDSSDGSGNSNTLTLTGTITTSAEEPTYGGGASAALALPYHARNMANLISL